MHEPLLAFRLPPLRPALVALLALGLAAGWALPASALQPLITEDTETQGRGGNQIEMAYDRERVRSPGERTTQQTWTAVYTRGLTDDLDGFLEASRARVRVQGSDDDGAGWGNPALGVKWRFWESESLGLSLGIKPEVQLGASRASERKDIASGRAGYAATFILTQETSFGAIHANLAATRVRYELAENREANRRTLYRLSVAPVFEVTPTWMLALDVGVTTNPDRARRARMGYIELGTIWTPRDDVELALGWIAPVDDGEPRSRTVTVGLTVRF